VEINKSHDITGVITTEAIVEGRHVRLTSHPGYGTIAGEAGVTDLTGRLVDEPGVMLPATVSGAARASYIITWPVTNMKAPMMLPFVGPTYSFALRQMFDQATNLPLTGRTIYMTYPGYQNAQTIPSGTLALGFNGVGGEFTLTSGQYVYSANLQIPGSRLRVCDAVTDGAAAAGMLAETNGVTPELAEVSRFNATTFALTFRHL